MLENKHQFAATQAPSSSNSNNVNKLSSKADYGIDPEGSLVDGKTSDSSPPYKRSTVPSDLKVDEIGGWTEVPVKSNENFRPNLESLLSKMMEDHANATSGKKHEAPLGGTTSNDIDQLSLKANYGSDPEGSLGRDDISDSSTPYTGSPASFEHQVKEIAGWSAGLAKSEQNCQRGVDLLIPSNVEEARSIFNGYGQALETLAGYESALVDPTNTSIVSRRHHLDAVGDPPHANATWKRSGNGHFERVASLSQGPSDGRVTKRTTNDPEKQELVSGASTSRRIYQYGGRYTILAVALILGISLYGLDMMGGFRCSLNASR